MEACPDHIPERLKWNGREILNFFVGEKMYRRFPTNKDIGDHVYAKIPKLCELSHNRGGIDNQLSEEADVLLNLDDPVAVNYDDVDVCTLRIKSLTDDNRYHKEFKPPGQQQTGVLSLVHDPIPCMYPHCVFRVYLDGEIVNHNNYDNTIKKNSKIRNLIREELASMIIQKVIDQDSRPLDNFENNEAAND